MRSQARPGAQSIVESMRSGTVRRMVGEFKEELLRKDYAGKCHTVQIGAVICKYKKWTVAELKTRKGTRSFGELCRRVGETGMCPKVYLEGIPEWVAMKQQMERVCACMGLRVRLLSGVALDMGVTRWKDGGRKTKEELAKAVNEAGGQRKRKYAELKNMVLGVGGSVRVSEDGKQRKLQKQELVAEYVRCGGA